MPEPVIQWLFVEEAAELLGVKRSTVHKYHNAGRLHKRREWPGVRGKTQFLYWRPEVEALKERKGTAERAYTGPRCTRCGCVLDRPGLCPDCYWTMRYPELLAGRDDSAWSLWGTLAVETMPNPTYHGVGG